MPRRSARRAIIAIASVTVLAMPSAAEAWQVTVHVHGGGHVDEITDRNLMSCTTSAGVARTTVTDCTAGTPNGLYNSWDIINLQAQVPAAHYDRGWRFLKWVDSKAGGGQINCDPQADGGNHFDDNCQFQIFENLETNLYFEDVHGPDASEVVSGPPSITKATSAVFGFNAFDDPDASFECRLDPPGPATGSYATCGSPSEKGEQYTGLTANGEYIFYVRGRDPSGNLDNTPDSHAWTIDTVAPAVTISGGPAHGSTTTSTSATFTVSADEGATPFCTLDGFSTSCNTTKAGLADGSHTFVASATDAAGNTGTQSRTWTVAAPPETTITAKPGAFSQASTAFEFSSSENGSTFTCTVDGTSAPCTSPKSLANLAPGPHTFAVAATDPAGNTDPTPATHEWTVDVTAPETQLLDGPAEGSTTPERAATFTFASPESASTFECRLNGGTFTPCSSPIGYSDLALGDHTFEVRAKDAAGNVDASPASRSWRVNTLDADADGINRPQDCRDDDKSIHPGASDVPDDGIDQDCDGVDTVNLDRDGDGANRPLDCDDTNAAIRPGATDRPADGIDQDCAGGDAARPQAVAFVSYRWGPPRARTKIVRLRLSKLARGATVTVRCRGRGCPVEKKVVRAPAGGVVDVRRLLKGRGMRAGATLTITVSVPEHVSKVLTFAFRRGKAPSGGVFRCLAPGAKAPAPC